MALKIVIDGKLTEVPPGTSILEACLQAGFYVPHLCHHPQVPPFDRVTPAETCFLGETEYRADPDAEPYAGCGLCLVQVAGRGEPVLSCITPVEEGMEILRTTPEIEARRRENLASILAEHPHACLTCAQREGCSLTQCSTNVPVEERCCPLFAVCELRRVAEYVGIREDTARYVPRGMYKEEGGPLFIRDADLCVGCLRCVRMCSEVIGAGALACVPAGGRVIVGTTRPSLEESGCRFCGACVEVCPTGALRDKDLKPGDREAALVPCRAACPLDIDVPAYVSFVREGRVDAAAALIEEKTPLAMTLGYICSRPCEEACRRGELNDPVAVCDLKRFALEASRHGKGSPPETSSSYPPKTGKRVAVVGAGPAGLVAAYNLARLGHLVTVYEARREAGGMLRWAVPEYRLPHHILMKDVEAVEKAGVRILTGTLVRADTLREGLRRGEWDALLLATGAQESRKIEVEGLSAAGGVQWGLDFLRAAKSGSPKKPGDRVVIIGGGNVAVDAAMTALRLGASEVRMVCLEKREEMPAFPWEIQEAEEEGVLIHDGWGPAEILSREGRVCGVAFQCCTAVFDEKGRFAPRFDPGKRMSLETDGVILAVGQKPDLSYLPPELGVGIVDGERIRVDPRTLEAGGGGVFAAGEVASGPGSAVEAMAAGRKAADAIDRFLGGRGIEEAAAPFAKEKNLWMGREEGFAGRRRVPMTSLPVEERFRSFAPMKLGYTRDEAEVESGRCLRCDQRLSIAAVVLPPEPWLPFNPEEVERVPDREGAFQLLDSEKKVIYIAGSPHLRQALTAQLESRPEARYFAYCEDPFYTKRESELLQQHMQKHGRLPSGNEDVDDLF